MQARDEMRARRGRAREHGAERAEQCGVLRGVPERVRREDDVGAYAGGTEEGWRSVGGSVPQACGTTAQFARASLRATFSRSVRISFASGKSLAMRMLGRPVPAPSSIRGRGCVSAAEEDRLSAGGRLSSEM
jgi:hypothetical protein